MTRIINNKLLFLLLYFCSCTNTKSIECFNIVDDNIIPIGSSKVKSIKTGDAPFNYTQKLIHKSGLVITHEFSNNDGILRLNSNVWLPISETVESYSIMDSMNHNNETIFLLKLKNVDSNDIRKVLCANSFDHVYGIRYDDGTPSVYIPNNDTSIVRKIYNLLVSSK